METKKWNRVSSVFMLFWRIQFKPFQIISPFATNTDTVHTGFVISKCHAWYVSFSSHWKINSPSIYMEIKKRISQWFRNPSSTPPCQNMFFMQRLRARFYYTLNETFDSYAMREVQLSLAFLSQIFPKNMFIIMNKVSFNIIHHKCSELIEL